jgi:endonuclease/exonuclease/phosphatase (EEP) superfamily protein YafD
MNIVSPAKYRLPADAAPIGINRPKPIAVWLWMILVLLIIQTAGCIRIPEEDWIISHRGPLETRIQTADCTAACMDQSTSKGAGVHLSPAAHNRQGSALNSAGFRLVSWNMFKGKKEGWAEDFRKLSRDTDILILQEAYLSNGLKHGLHRERFHWDMTAAFTYRQIETGVLTAAKAVPNFACTFRDVEPLTRIPKSVLITRYAMSGTDRELLVANIHAINFTMGLATFQKQGERLEKVLAAHQGPIILSGDFNTWSSERMALVDAMAKRLGLKPVRFDQNRRTQFFGQFIDHIYYRGLEAQHAKTPMVATSDHNPLTVVFKLADEIQPI